MWYLVVSLFSDRLAVVRYLFMVCFVLFYLYLGPSGSDENTYQTFFRHSCNGGRILGSIEPLFQYYNKLFGFFRLCSAGAELSIVVFYLLFLFLAQPLIRKYLNSQETFYVLLILTFYLVSYQLAHNYRTGMASMLSILALLTFPINQNYSKLYAVTAIGFHIQVFPVLALFFYFNSVGRAKIALLITMTVLILINSNYFIIFMYEQALKVFSGLSGKYRLSYIPYLFIYLFVIISIDKVKLPNMKGIYYFGLAANTLFFFNAHLASRLTRVVEPLLMVGFYFALKSRVAPLSRQLRVLICLIPGLLFVIIQRSILT
tara:strand:- start:3931 stop:4881 length:951 start_codon:yes stop_codon:yes gene_type:complete